MLTPNSIESCIQRLREEEGNEEDRYDNLVKTFLDLMTKLDIKMSVTKMQGNPASNVTSDQYNVVISRNDKKIKTSFPVSYSQIDLSDILLTVRMILLDIDLSLEKYCKHSGIDSDNPASKMKYKQRVKTAMRLNRIFSDNELNCLPTSSSASDEFDKEIVELNSEFEYNKLHDLQDTVLYYDKLLFQYGYDSKKDQWDMKRFPVTRTDRQMEGIKSDIDNAHKAVEEYNQYLEYLARKYDLDINEEGCIFLPLPESTKHKSR